MSIDGFSSHQEEPGVKPKNLIEKDAPKTEAEAQENQENRLAMQTLFEVSRDGGRIKDLFPANPKLEGIAKRILESKEYNPENLKLEDLENKADRPRTKGERGTTDNAWKNMIQLPDGRAVANPFAVAAGLGRENVASVEKTVVEQTKKPEVVEQSEEPDKEAEAEKARVEEQADKARIDRTERAEQDKEKSEADAAKILEEWMIPEEPTVNLSEGGLQEGFDRGTIRQERVGVGGSVSQKNVGLPGMNARVLGEAIQEANDLGAKDIVDTTEKPKGFFAKMFGGFGKKPAEGSQTTEAKTAADQKENTDLDIAA